MKVLSLPIEEVMDITGNQPITDCVSRKSSFCYELKVEDGFILFNTLTKECLLIEKSEYYGESIKDVLFEKWFYVPSDFDELQFVDDLRNIFLCTLHQTPGIKGYTILPTTDCNARCFYCFEANSKKKSMSDDVANRVVEYIDKTHRRDSKVSISWFGGEPLYNVKAINIICSGLKSKNINFRSSMVSNGYLFDTEIIGEAKELWNLNRVQITLDGTEKTYNKVKAYIYDGVNAFERVLCNIDNLLSSEIDVSIRLNIDAYNMKDMCCLVEGLATRYKGRKGLSVYSHPLFEEVGKCGGFVRTHERRKEICESQKLLDEKIVSLGLNNSSYVINKSFMNHYCMADSYDEIVVLPDGHLTKCESCLDGNYVGHIDDATLNEDMLAKYSKHCDKLEECKICPLYPECIRLEVCHDAKKCHKEFRDKKIADIEAYIRNEYKSYLERQKKDESV
ncbi:MAG: 4Fe-4S cluster-binding domain-containing protein [Bacteroidaceae bacterium]|nr:4Fe-4S cluster-binding domain-containing protein [Bacteroidaceae bacterium]